MSERSKPIVSLTASRQHTPRLQIIFLRSDAMKSDKLCDKPPANSPSAAACADAIVRSLLCLLALQTYLGRVAGDVEGCLRLCDCKYEESDAVALSETPCLQAQLRQMQLRPRQKLAIECCARPAVKGRERDEKRQTNARAHCRAAMRARRSSCIATSTCWLLLAASIPLAPATRLRLSPSAAAPRHRGPLCVRANEVCARSEAAFCSARCAR
jgi:hypothetical protein